MISNLISPIRLAFERGKRMFQLHQAPPPWPAARTLDKRLAAEWLGYEIARVTALAERENAARVLGRSE